MCGARGRIIHEVDPRLVSTLVHAPWLRLTLSFQHQYTKLDYSTANLVTRHQVITSSKVASIDDNMRIAIYEDGWASLPLLVLGFNQPLAKGIMAPKM